MTNVILLYPYFQPLSERSIFRFPPLGLGYLAAYLKEHGISVDLVDCTFLSPEEVLQKIRRSNPRIIGIYSMFSMKKKATEFANLLREDCDLLVAGGPLPTLNPQDFLQHFDAVVIGEGERTVYDIACVMEENTRLSEVKGIAYKKNGRMTFTPPREPIWDLDSIPFPSRELFDNQAYKSYYIRKFGYSVTSMITSRGCPFKCDFCSQPVFGNQVRTRSAENIVDEIESVLELGYQRVWFTDDCFTLERNRIFCICNEIIRRDLNIDWECLSRVDTIDREVLERMKQAGCRRIFFGIESGTDSVLSLMNKKMTTKEAVKAVKAAKEASIETGAFFIVGYPGETDDTILETVRFASSLPLDYLSFTLPYPIPGTPLYEKVKNRIITDDWSESKDFHIVDHKLIYRSHFSEIKLKFAILKGMVQFKLRKCLKDPVYRFIGEPFEHLTDFLFRLLN
ncbi:MAG: B12-binding domain-containing radical SAM protein [Candidatus Bathyarchaeota archaeon]|nr:MAG: B12-binding domain-containing radical SAM protein [Candidatus Bathyarchaeota archaeon]